MTKKPYELLARFNDNGTVRGVSVRWINTVDGIDYEGAPVPLADETNPVFTQFANLFAAAAVSERDTLITQLQNLEAENQTLRNTSQSRQATIDQLTAQVADLTQQLADALNPASNPRHLAPFDFVSLFMAAELVAIQTSTDPLVIVGRTQVQTIITYIDLDSPQTQNFVGYLEQIGIIGTGRAAQILSGNPPSE